MVGDLYPEFYPLLLPPPAFGHRGPSGDLPETSLSSSSCKATVKASSPQPPPSPPLSDGPLADALLLCEETLLSQGESEVEDVLLWADGEKAGPGATAPGDPPSELGLLWWWERRRALPAAWQVQSEEPGDNRDLLVPDSDDVAVVEEDEGAGGRAPTTWRKGPARSPCWPHDEAAAGAREVPRAAEEPLPTSSPGDSKVGEEEKTRRPVASPPGSSGYHCNESDSEDQVDQMSMDSNLQAIKHRNMQ